LLRKSIHIKVGELKSEIAVLKVFHAGMIDQILSDSRVKTFDHALHLQEDLRAEDPASVKYDLARSALPLFPRRCFGSLFQLL